MSHDFAPEPMKQVDPSCTPVVMPPEASPPARLGLFPGLLIALFYLLLLGLAGGLCGLVWVGWLVNLSILAHILGHYVAARLFGVRVRAFSLGFGRALPGARWAWGETACKLSLIPLGGYVSLARRDDPFEAGRSVEDRPFWQGMLVQLAGPLVSALMVLICCVALGYVGERRIPGVVGMVDAGSPAWQAGIQSGDVLGRLADVENPTFNDLKLAVPLASGDIAIGFGPPGKSQTETSIAPRRNPGERYPTVGLTPSMSLQLAGESTDGRSSPVWRQSAAARAQPAFQFGDEIIATTDPDDPVSITDLPRNQRNPQATTKDYFAFRERLQRLAGREMIVRVLRQGKPVDINLPPAFYPGLGLRMQMGPVIATRPLANGRPHPLRSWIQADGVRSNGDVITAVEVTELGGQITRWLAKHGPAVPAGQIQHALDPVRLPEELRVWRERIGKPGSVKLTVIREDADEPVTVQVPWDDRYRFAHEVPLTPAAPMAIPELGIAYLVRTTVEESTVALVPGLPTIQHGDVVTAVDFWDMDRTTGAPVPSGKPVSLWPTQWAYITWRFAQPATEVKQLTLHMERQGQVFAVTLAAGEDPTWPMVERGLVFDMDSFMHRARGPIEAVGVGAGRAANFWASAVSLWGAYLSRRLEPETVGGPVMVITAAAERQGREVLLFFALRVLIAANVLMVVANLLPLPGADAWSLGRLLLAKCRGASTA